ncbi:MAG TPA: hypothetical protein VGM17_05510 [Rhizomicrobium sp.]|jgi:hypothetical protein
MKTTRGDFLPAAGFFFGGVGWAFSTLVGFDYAFPSCARQMMASGIVAIIGLVIAAAGALVSWRAARVLQAINVAPAMPARHTRIFLARFGMLAAALFGFAIVLQLAAALVFTGCEQ